ESELVKFVGKIGAAGAVDFVDRQRHRFAELAQHARQIAIRRSQLGAPVDQKNNIIGALQGHTRLAQDFAEDENIVAVNDAADVDQLEFSATVLDFAIDAVAHDAGFIADNGAARAHDRVEKRGF